MLWHASHLVGNVSSEPLATSKTSGWSGGSAKWRMGTHGRDPTARANDNLQGVSPRREGTTAESRKMLIRKSRHNVKRSPSCVMLPTCLSIQQSVSRHLKLLFCQWSAPQWPATTGHDLNSEQKGQTGALQKQMILEEQRKHCRCTLGFRSILERYVEIGLERPWVSSYCRQPLLQSLLQAGCRRSWSELGERQLSHLCSAVWLIELWIQTLKSETPLLSAALWHIRGKEFKDVGDNSIERNVIFESSLKLEENREGCLLSFPIKMQSDVSVHSVNMTISSFLPVNLEQI